MFLSAAEHEGGVIATVQPQGNGNAYSINLRAVTIRDVEAIIDLAVDLANQVESQNVIIHVFANEDANGDISADKNNY